MSASFFGHKKTSKPNDLKVLLARSTFGYHQAKTKAGYAGYLLKKPGGVRRGIWSHSGAKLAT
jgi:hypothetical protein